MFNEIQYFFSKGELTHRPGVNEADDWWHNTE